LALILIDFGSIFFNFISWNFLRDEILRKFALRIAAKDCALSVGRAAPPVPGVAKVCKS
jgi:hypothetical protein